MRVYHIGMISFENKNAKRELKAIGGIQGYIIELVNFLLSKDVSIGFVGKIYNFNKTKNLRYFEVKKDVTSTNLFLILLFFKSFFIKLPKNTVIHAHRPDHFTAFAFLKNRASVVSLHGQQAKTVNDRKGKLVREIYNFLEKIALKKTNAIVAVDDITKDYYLKRYPEHQQKIHVIPTGVNVNNFKLLDKKVLRKKFGFSEDDKIILYVGRIEPPKKIADIIKAFKILSLQNKSYKLIFVGDGVMLNEMKELSINLGLEKSINFFGIRKRKELPEIYNLADISVLYSENEGSPLSIKESLACGVPVVANCVGDVSLVIKNDYNGYLVEEENDSHLALKMKLAVANSSLFKQDCIESIQNFTTDKVNQKVLDLYKKVLDEK